MTPFVTNMVPTKYITTENKDFEGQQSEHKYAATPVRQTAGAPVKIKYSYDGKSAMRTEEYANGESKFFPITFEEYENALKQSQYAAAGRVTVQSTKNPSAASSSSSSYRQKVESESSQSVLTSGSQAATPGSSLVHKIITIPIKTHGSESSSSYGYQQASSGSGRYVGNTAAENQLAEQGQAPAVLVHNVQTVLPVKTHSSSSSSSSSYSYHKSSGGNFDGGEVESLGEKGIKHGALLVQGVPLSQTVGHGGAGNSYSSSSSYSSASSQYSNSGFGPGKGNFHEVKTSYSSNSSNNNGKKSENREASVSVNDNGKVDSYHVKS